MPYLHEAKEVPFRDNMEMLSRHRPPQLNGTVCGCRCGCGCNNVFGGNDDDQSEDGQKTLVDEPNYFDDEQSFSPLSAERRERHVDVVNIEPFTVQLRVPTYDRDRLGGIQAGFGGLMDGTEGLHPNQPSVSADEGYPRLAGSSPREEYEDGADSMTNEPYGSEDHSVVSSDGRSVRCISPGPGIGGWIEQDQMSSYHFLVRPLRLTPQRRYCRGLLAPNAADMTEYLYDDGD